MPRTISSAVDFHMLFEASPNPYVLLEADLTIRAMNEAYLAVTMRSRDDLVGRNMFDAFPSDPASPSHKQLRTSLERVAREHVTDHLPLIHYSIPRPDGAFEDRYWSATHIPLFDREGAFAFILQHTVDVTEIHRLRQFAMDSTLLSGPAALLGSDVMRRAEAVQAQKDDLESERRRLLRIFDQAPGFMAVLNGPEHVFVMANRAYQRLVGGRDVIGMRAADALPEVVGQGFIDLLDSVYRCGEAHVGRGVGVMLRDESGNTFERFVDFVYQPIENEEGIRAGIFVQGHDVTEQKRAATALRESEERFRLIAESAPIMLWMGDQAGRCVFLNRPQREFWGIGEEDLAGFNWGDTVHPEDQDALYGPFAEGMEKQIPFQVEARFRRADGEYRLISASARPRFDGSGAFLGMIGVNVDVTETRRIEQDLRQINEMLGTRVIEEIAERRQAEVALQKAQKMESIGRLTGGVAHDFNNLLQVISGNLQMLERQLEGDAKAQRRIANAMAGVERGAGLAKQLLAFARRQPLEPRVIDPGKLVDAFQDMLRRTIGEAIDVEVDVPSDLWNTFADPLQLENALLNLAINARDAMDGRGKLTVELSNAQLDDLYAVTNEDVVPGDYVMLAVSDTGCGMDSELIERVFEPFFTTKGEGKGSGLGLAMVYGFVKQSGGHVKIYSEPGIGTSVKIYLPRALGAEQARPRDDAPVVQGGTETILVAEDDEEVRETVVGMLEDLGYNVLTAGDAAAALVILQSGVAVDLLFTDVVMPGELRSTELVRRARELVPEIGILFTSGYTENAIVHGGRLDEGVDLLSKPYTRDMLALKIREVLDRPAAGGGEEAGKPALRQ